MECGDFKLYQMTLNYSLVTEYNCLLYDKTKFLLGFIEINASSQSLNYDR